MRGADRRPGPPLTCSFDARIGGELAENSPGIAARPGEIVPASLNNRGSVHVPAETTSFALGLHAAAFALRSPWSKASRSTIRTIRVPDTLITPRCFRSVNARLTVSTETAR
jgi:hypothetical protein